MSSFDSIRPYDDEEVAAAIAEHKDHPLFKGLLQFTFPEKSADEIETILNGCHSIFDFQTKVIYHSVQQVVAKSSNGFSASGFDKLKPEKAYLFLSNHRDIVLDTSFINVALYDHNLIMTASAIGDNLVQKSFLMALARLNRSFIVRRGQAPREMLKSSRLLSEYIQHLLDNKRSIWMAQREGRTKNGDDRTQQGVLKMLAMNKGDLGTMKYLKSLDLVAVAISYEYDPTDILKVPELVAKSEDLTYIKSSNEDFNSILRGAAGAKKRIHIHAEPIDSDVFNKIEGENISDNDKLQLLVKQIDRAVHRGYKLWPSNYIAYDLYHGTTKFSQHYTDKEKQVFERRLLKRTDASAPSAEPNFLLMYANPVINKLHLEG
ncbi:MAG: 1-acyl-sn-glycerol-3-phosphate acyltransferase [Leeuwenhoekiella sp.]